MKKLVMLKMRLNPDQPLLAMGVLSFFLMISAFTGPGAYAQNIQGIISDAENGDPIIGATVLELDTENNGTTTDFDGKFQLEAQTDNPVLVVSYVGYQSVEVPYNGEELLEIQLSGGLALNEIVVTALGIKREKKALGYAVQEIGGPSLVVARENNIANAISGKIAGLQVVRGSNGPAGSSKIVLRGNNSLTGDNQPLIVIDGVPMDNFTGASNNDFWNPSTDMGNGLGDLNPENIESMSVLKGASAAALYGSRAGNGVILITTKTGKAQDGLGITYSGTLGSSSMFMKPEIQSVFGQGNNGIYNNLSSQSWGPEIAGQSIELWDGSTGKMEAHENLENYFGSGTSWNHSLSFQQQMNEATSLFSSINYLSDNSMIPGATLDRLNLMTRSVSNFGRDDSWTTDVKVQYIKSTANNRPLNGVNISNSFATMYLLPRSIDVTSFSEGSDEFGNMIWYLPSNAVNPYWNSRNNLNSDTRDRFMVNGSVKNQLTDWMYAEIRAGFDLYNTNTESKLYGGSPLATTGRYSLGSNSFTEGNYSALLSASKDNILGNLGGTINLGGNLMHQTHKSLSSNSGLLVVPNLFSLNNGEDNPTVGQGFSERKLNSLYGTVQFNYGGYLFLDVTGRNDWSSTLSKENRSFFYPSVSTSWVFTDMIEANGGNVPNWLMFGKIRASYAEVGNDLPAYQLYNYYSIGNDPNGNTTASKNNVLFNPDVKSELIKSWEVGIDARMFENRLGIDFSYYKSNATRQLINIPLNPLSGYNSKKVNAGNIENKGVELTINGTIIENTNGFNWDMSLNYAKNINTVVELTEDVTQYGLGGFDNISILAVSGQPYGEIWGTEFKRVEDESSPHFGQIIVDDEGIPLSNPDKVRLGNQQPDALVGFNNTFTYKNISLSMLIDGRFGGEIFSGTNRALQQAGNAAATVVNGARADIIYDGVVENEGGGYSVNSTPVSPEIYWTTLSERSGNLGITENNIYDASNIRIRTLQLNYSFPRTLIQNTGMQKLQIGASMNNVAMLSSHLKGVDPESVYATATNAVGFENLSSPTSRSVFFNLVVGF
ncbi:SusC/RagA family TonB-linked outer membrane protein [Membranicola marinus]|uniref:SusC/RagA family TonB-linked outer membrane protein n=2 Tax=Membranihabitans marinus TaxID=1227546 RepID=A0A953L681_9BACT|nr:SusC/RagA family TonB-linked outer membrane protein [Membranihabitans marinus]MBY5957372.1 SusC/RagA family TonB-linked outer membrane protein [Membranihabitans marinus]